MENLKAIIGVFLGSVALVVLMAFGLSKMSGGESGAAEKVDLAKLTEGATLVYGPQDAKVTVVEFTDMQCPACKSAYPITTTLKGVSDVKIVYRHFPLIQIHKNAWKGAKAVEAARGMGKGFEMMDVLFEKQVEWSELGNPDEKLIGYAKTLGLDVAEFEQKYKSDEVDQIVARDNALAGELKLSGTPTFFVNGDLVAADFVISKTQEILKGE